MHILQDQEVNTERWNQFLLANDCCSPFQSHAYFTFYNSVPNLVARVYAVEENNVLLALCVITLQKEPGILGFFSRRAIIYGGPLVTRGEKGETALNMLLEAINERISNKAIFIETYNFNDYSDFKVCFSKNGWHYEPHLNVQIVLLNKSMAEVMSAMKYNRRREINMSLKEGAIFREAVNEAEIMDLYNILVKLYNTRVKLPLPNFHFFWRLFLSEVGKVFVVIHNDKIIGGSFCAFIPNKSIYTYYYCGLREYQKSVFPSHLAIYAVLDFGLKNNLQHVDLMGAGKPDKEYGVREFKVRFGGELFEQGRFLQVYKPLLFHSGIIGLKVLKFLKR